MSGTTTGRRYGVNAGAAIKVPCKVATTVNITLSDEQTIDGVSCTEDDRVLVKNQTDPIENGIWNVSTGSWRRSPDFDGQIDVVEGSLVTVTSGSVNSESIWRVTTSGDITPGTTAITFTLAGLGPNTTTTETVTHTNSNTGAVLRQLNTRLDVISYVSDFGSADPTGVIDSTTAFQDALDVGGAVCIDGAYLITGTLTINKPIHLFGYGNFSQVIVDSTVDAITDIFEINPDLSEDKYQWTLENFYVKAESGVPARHVFNIDITTANKFIAKNHIKNVRADKFGGDYLYLTNPVNTDGYFTSAMTDNFCNNGIELINAGDSLYYQRNTHTGANVGPAFTIFQLGDASNITIEDSNITTSGGALAIQSGRNIVFQNNTVELNDTFDGLNGALVSVDGPTTPAISYTTNTKILNNNLNTKGNTTKGIYIGYSTNTVISGNTIFVNPATDVHIEISANAYNTIIDESNRYLTSVTGAEVTASITDNGFGTMGILKDYTITLGGWALIDAANNHPAQFIKDNNGMVTMYGALAGGAAGVAATLFTLPLGFRPVRIVKFWTHDTAGNPYIIDVLPTGQVQIPAGGATQVYLDGMTWHSPKVTV